MAGRYTILETSEDDWITASIQVESIDLAKMLIFGLGAQTVIIEPDELRQSVLATAREMVNVQA